MNESDPGITFRGLPLSPEQDSEIRHYIHVRTRGGLPWDTPELQAMIADMLDPPETGADDAGGFDDDSAWRFSDGYEPGLEQDIPLRGHAGH